MITGRFNALLGRPQIEGRIYIPRFNVEGEVTFLLDTGADRTMLMPADAFMLGIPLEHLIGAQKPAELEVR